MRPLAVFHSDYKTYLQEVLKATGIARPVFLCNPRWEQNELHAAAHLIPRGTPVAGSTFVPHGDVPENWPDQWMDCLMIPTGGTGGKIKFVIHNKKTLRAAAKGLQGALEARGLSPVLHGASFTPPWHVSGLMPVWRAQVSGGEFGIYDGRFLATAPLPEIKLPLHGTTVASLVPTQLSRIIHHPDGLTWLRRFKVILLGGSSIPHQVLDEIRIHRLPVYVTYGMTETAAACALCPPERIWEEKSLAGTPLPGVRFKEQDHKIIIDSPALGLGYWNGETITHPYTTGDLGTVHADGTVEVHGRADRLIITGGEKVDPERVESVLKSSGTVQDIHVFGVVDAHWGESVVACVVASEYNTAAIHKAAEALEPAARPKHYIFVEKLPLDLRGKFDRAAAERLLQR